MPLPNSGPISLQQVATELAGQLDLLYYAGRTYNVAGGGTRTISAAPSLFEFYGLQGAGGGPLAITGFNPPSPIGAFRPTPGVLSQTFSVVTSGGTGPYGFEWSIVSNNAGGGFSSATDVQNASFNTGFLSGGTFQTVLRCRVWDSAGGNVSADLTIDWEVIN